jgi:hypothetical protein
MVMMEKLSEEEKKELLHGIENGPEMPTNQFKAMMTKHYLGIGHKYDKAKEIVDVLCKKHGIT